MNDVDATRSGRWRLLTPSRAGAIAIVEIASDKPSHNLSQSRIAVESALVPLGLGGLKTGDIQLRSLAGVDQGLVARWSDDLVHLMPHGGSAVVRALVDALAAMGIERAESEQNAQQIRRSYPEGADEVECCMLEALSRAQSPLAVDMLLKQPALWREYQGDECSLQVLDRLVEPPLVVVRGAANVGKSTLVNALAGRAVSVVANEPGTTRDHVGVLVNMAGLVVRLLDLPGDRAGAPEIERQAMAIALNLARGADLTLWCSDENQSPNLAAEQSVEPDGAANGNGGGSLKVALKADLGSGPGANDHTVSAQTGQGIPQLVTSIRDRLIPPEAMADPRPWRFWQAADLNQDRAPS